MLPTMIRAHVAEREEPAVRRAPAAGREHVLTGAAIAGGGVTMALIAIRPRADAARARALWPPG
jgi:hypothetical protein